MHTRKLVTICALPLLAFAATIPAPANSIILRHDVKSDEYVASSWPEAIIDMPGEGHGVLIAPEWIVTAAHVIFADYRGRSIMVGGAEHEIEAVVFHPGYSRPPSGIFTGDSERSQAFLRGNHDIALIKLKSPAKPAPLPIYRGSEETGQHVRFFGRGSTGVGLSGQIARSGGTMRQAENKVDHADGQWLFYDFDAGGQALPFEGIQGDGDSGGPAIMSIDGESTLAGLVSWDVYDGDIADFQGGLYGMSGALIRLSYYAEWIDEVMAMDGTDLSARHNKLGG